VVEDEKAEKEEDESITGEKFAGSVQIPV